MSLHQDPAQTHPWLSAEQGILTAQGQGPWNHGITESFVLGKTSKITKSSLTLNIPWLLKHSTKCHVHFIYGIFQG